MSQSSAPIVDNSGNFAIVHLPGRRFPALVLPGDSLSSLCSDVEELVNELKVALGPEHVQVANAEAILKNLQERLAYYNAIVRFEDYPPE